jgi:GDPmannose 4,6-dehydratase
MRTAIVLGASGQDGTYLSEFLLLKDYTVYGLYRPRSSLSINQLFPEALTNNTRFIPKPASVTNFTYIREQIFEIMPNEIYYLASNHELDCTWPNFQKSREINLDGLANVLDTITSLKNDCRLFYASSSNIFLGSESTLQDENTDHAPATLYGFFKSSAMALLKMHREQFGVFACAGILYNHESPRRNEYYVSQKIIKSAVKILRYGGPQLRIGNINATRDWGYAADYVEAMWLMLQNHKPVDYIIGSGKLRSVEWFLDYVFSRLNLKWRNHVVLEEALVRKVDSARLLANPQKIKEELGWVAKTPFEDVIKIMLEKELSDSLNH